MEGETGDQEVVAALVIAAGAVAEAVEGIPEAVQDHMIATQMVLTETECLRKNVSSF